MGRVKGCVNEKCIAHEKKFLYKETEEYCSKCGVKLDYVCKTKKCYTFLEKSDSEYCIKCQAKKDDRKDDAKKAVLGAGGALLTIGGVVATKGKTIIKYINKLK
jgi:hypothetical protein